MEVLRVEIRAITASFRYPMFVVSYQPTYKIPPISTIYGLLSAAKGEKVSIYDLSIGYDFTSRGSGVDLERILEFGGGDKNKPVSYLGSNIIHREFLYDCILTLYISDLDFKQYLENPRFTLLLGRQSDLAKITKIKEVKLIPKENVEIYNTIIPFDGRVPGQIVALPSDYTDKAERKPIEVRTYCIVESKQQIERGYYDTELNKGVFMHEFNNKSQK
ncbi:MAG: type I-B CRISPR-associated protein Cas5b [Candidatus Methanoperedens sp.]|nr:type I-B CRISPR-associated protein Cas5b [Candidatus Methanoperedens sp.]MCZ7369993.1 type I-B CRISPR-associated protein Cas5b [Candidatus Methanoperedens sp.]